MCKGGIIQLLLEILNGLTHADPFEASAWRWTTDTSIQALCDPWRVQIKIVQMLKIVQVFYLFWPASKYKNETIDGRFWKTTIVVLAFASSCWNQRFVLTLVPAILVQLHFKNCWSFPKVLKNTYDGVGVEQLVPKYSFRAQWHTYRQESVMWEWNDEWWVIRSYCWCSEILNNHLECIKTDVVNNGIHYQPQPVRDFWTMFLSNKYLPPKNWY